VADTPGHRQYTRNMITGASIADAALLLVDTRKGLLTQTRRHSHLVALLGIRHVALAVNKMDKARFDRILGAYRLVVIVRDAVGPRRRPEQPVDGRGKGQVLVVEHPRLVWQLEKATDFLERLLVSAGLWRAMAHERSGRGGVSSPRQDAELDDRR
jgi:translation elongation factor EF-G